MSASLRDVETGVDGSGPNVGAFRGRSRAAGAIVLCVLLGCGLGNDADARGLSERVQPHLNAFERFDRWARRTLHADLALRDPIALEEALFAPIRRAEGVCAAWVERTGPDARATGFRLSEAPALPWVPLRGVPLLDGLEAAAGHVEAVAPRHGGAASARCVLGLRRRAASGRGTGEVQVTVLFDAATTATATAR